MTLWEELFQRIQVNSQNPMSAHGLQLQFPGDQSNTLLASLDIRH